LGVVVCLSIVKEEGRRKREEGRRKRGKCHKL
jgi:hypothetical protein